MTLTSSQNINIPVLTASQLVATDGSKNLVSVTALPSGTTAVTQSASDNSTKVATTAYVDAAIPATPSGTYTPSFSGATNATSITSQDWLYTRIGPVVTVTGYVSFTAATGLVQSIFNISLPVASNLTDSRDLTGGGWSAQAILVNSSTPVVDGDITNDNAKLTFVPSSSGSGQNIRVTFTYIVK